MNWRPLIVMAAGLVLATGYASGATLQARLIRGTADPKADSPELKELKPKLVKVFGYPHYEQLTVHQATLKDRDPVDMDLGRGFVLFVKPKSVEKETYVVEIELTSGKASFVKSTFQVNKHGTVFIKGPEVGNTLVLVALTVQE